MVFLCCEGNELLSAYFYKMGMDTVELIMKVEDRFAIRFENKEAERLVTVGDIYNAVWNHISANAAGTTEKSSTLTDRQRLEIETIINYIIADHAGIDVKDITPLKSLTSDLGLD